MIASELRRDRSTAWPTEPDGTSWVAKKLAEGPRVPFAITRATKLFVVAAGLHLFFMLGWTGGEIGPARLALRSWLFANDLYTVDRAAPLTEIWVQLEATVDIVFLVLIITGFLAVLPWLLCAALVHEGRSWARLLCTGLMVAGAVNAVILTALLLPAGMLVESGVLVSAWLLGVIGVVGLWLPTSTRHFARATA